MSSTARKGGSVKKTAAKPATRSRTRAEATKPVVAKAARGNTATPAPAVPSAVTKKELVARLVADQGMKKGEARRAVEAVLDAIGQSLREGRSITAAPLGKVTITREKETANGKLVIARIKLKEPRAAEALASAPKEG